MSDETMKAHESALEALQREVATLRQNVAAFQRDKERYLKVQFAVDMKQRELKAELKKAHRALSDATR